MRGLNSTGAWKTGSIGPRLKSTLTYEGCHVSHAKKISECIIERAFHGLIIDLAFITCNLAMVLEVHLHLLFYKKY